MLIDKLCVDAQCEIAELFAPLTECDQFWRFDELEIRPGWTYVIGRLEMERCLPQIRKLAESGTVNIVFSNPAEGSHTMHGQFQKIGIGDLAKSGAISIISGGTMEPEYRNFYLENFAFRLARFEENHTASKRVGEIYAKTVKPYTFLFLNGRLRPHRKWMLARLRQLGILHNSLYTNLHSRGSITRKWQLLDSTGKDILGEVEPLQLLPRHYEVDRYQSQVNTNTEHRNIKDHLFEYNGTPEWGEVYIKTEPYIDTYFSLVSETVFDYPYSFRTEKLWKPIMCGHPFVIMANAGYYKDLHNIGFLTFPDLIDESFDTIDDHSKRAEAIAQSVKQLCESDLKSFLSSAQKRAEYNQHRFNEYVAETLKEFPERFKQFKEEQYG